jgi:hypothetical protein
MSDRTELGALAALAIIFTTRAHVCLDVHGKQNTTLRRLTAEYEFTMRLAFMRMGEDILKTWPTARHCTSPTGLLLRYAKDAVHEDQGLITSQYQVTRCTLTLWQSRVNKTQLPLTSLRKNRGFPHESPS